MKRKRLMLLSIFLLSTFFFSSFVNEDCVYAMNGGSPQLNQLQGENGWYLCQYSSKSVSELIWHDDDSSWYSAENIDRLINKTEMLPYPQKDVNFKFVPDQSGLYKLSWDISWKNNSENSDGITMSIHKNNETVWERNIQVGGNSNCSVEVDLVKGEEVHFRANCNANNIHDEFNGYPKVELIGVFLQKNDEGVKELLWDKDRDVYMADDGVARISMKNVLPTEDNAVIRRYIVPAYGRYRIQGTINPEDKEGNANVLRVYKNGKIVKSWLCLSNQKTTIDAIMLAQKDDIIDIEMSVQEYEGFNNCKWNIKIENMPGTIIESQVTTTAGNVYKSITTKKLSEYIAGYNLNEAKLYTKVNGIEYPMYFDTSRSRWEETYKQVGAITLIPKKQRQTPDDYADTVLNDVGYVQSSKVVSTAVWVPGSETIIEIPVTKDGCILIDGTFYVNSSNDGELIKVYVNDELLWSNRVGGESSVRFDEEYLSQYFQNRINAFSKVSKGDKIRFVFNKWRMSTSDENIDISDIGISYIEGNVLSKTTSWKLKNSLVADAMTNNVYFNGEKVSEDMYVENGTTYISSKLANGIMDKAVQTNEEYIPLRTAAEINDKNVKWIAGRYAVVFEGIDDTYTWNEISEIKTQTAIIGGIFNE